MSDFFLHIKDSKIDNPVTVRKAFANLKDGYYKVKIDKASKRSSSQNRFFHGPMLDYIFQGLRDAGFSDVKDKEDAKAVVKSIFLKRSFASEDGLHVIEIIQDTHKLTKEEMNILIEDVIQWGSEYLGIQIPYPNEKLLLNF